MSARASEHVSATDERFVVWSPDTTTCMIWTSRARAEQFAQFWRDTRLLGSHGWRVGRVVGEPREIETAPLAVRQALAAADPMLQGEAAGLLRPYKKARSTRIGSQPADGTLEAEALDATRPERLRSKAERPEAECRVGGGNADETLATARDEFVALLAAKDALIAQLRHQVNDLTLANVREATVQSRRIAELERRLAESARRGGGR